MINVSFSSYSRVSLVLALQTIVQIHFARLTEYSFWCVRSDLGDRVVAGNHSVFYRYVVCGCLADFWDENLVGNPLWGRGCNVYLTGNDFPSSA